LRLKALIVFWITLFLFHTVSAQELPVRGDRLKIGCPVTRPLTVNPLLADNEFESDLARLLFGEGLFIINDRGEVDNGLAISVLNAGDETWQIVIRSNISFHDGTAVTSDDVEFSFNLYRKFSGQIARFFNARIISRVIATDNRTVRFSLYAPEPEFRRMISGLPILPRHIYEEWLQAKSPEDMRSIDPVGYGPFLYRYRDAGGSIHLDSFSDYSHGEVFLSGIDYIVFENPARAVDAFLEEQVDMVLVQDKSVLQKIYQITSRRENILMAAREDLKLYFIDLNNQYLPFSDLNMRRALNYAVNRNILVQRILLNKGMSTTTLLTEKSPDYLNPRPDYQYDPLTSLNILNNTGYRKQRDGKLFQGNRELKFEFLFESDDPFQESVMRMLTINFAELGINIFPRPVSRGELERAVSTGDYQAALRFVNYHRSESAEIILKYYLESINHDRGFKNFNDKSVNQLVQFSSKTYSSGELRPILHRIQHLLNINATSIFLFYEDRVFYALSKRFQNIKKTVFQNGEYMVKLKPKNEWFVPADRQKY
jgi:ABC-type transport system substrate-binding protein